MSDDESNQQIQKIFNQYQIKLTSNMDYINILIQNNNTFNIYESKFNLEYLHQFKLLMPNLTINEMIEFINNSINEKGIKIEENENNYKFILISKITAYPNVELILNKKNIIEKLIKEIEGIKNENKILKNNFEVVKNKIELIEEENKKLNMRIYLIEKEKDKINKNEELEKKEEYKKLNMRIDLVEKEKKELKNKIESLIKLNKKEKINNEEYLNKIELIKKNNEEYLKKIEKEKINNEELYKKIELIEKINNE